MPAYKYQTKDGRTKWYANFYYTDWLGQKKHKCKRGFASKKDAKEWERKFLDRGSKDPTILFSSLVDNYLEDMESRLKPTTLEGKRYIFESKITPFFGEMQICDIDPVTVHRWQNALIEYRDESGKPYSQTYLKTINNQLSAILNFAVKFYGLQSNPCKATGSIGKSRAEEMNIWTRDQFEEFLTYEKKITYRMAFSLLFYGGIREGELLALTPSDIPEDEALIDINKNYAVVNGQAYFLTPKSEKSIRIVTIPQSLHDELIEYIRAMNLEPDERIFYFQKEGLLSEFRRVTEKSGLPRIRIHDLRHSHASMLIDMGRSIKEIADRLGHESPQTTWDVYSHLYPGKDRELADELDKIRKPKNVE